MLNDLKEEYILLRNNDNVQKIYHYFKDKNYMAIFYKQFNCLISNLNSIEILVNANYIEDAFTIFRKYLETYFTLMCIVNHPDLVFDYLKHNEYLMDKSTGNNKNKLKEIRENHPDGYLEYGYVEKYLDDKKIEKYTNKMVATVAGVKQFYQYYNKCSNFVHNNLTSVKIDLTKAKNALNIEIKNTIELLVRKVNKIINSANI